MPGTPSSAFAVATTSAATMLAADANVLYYLRGYRAVNTGANTTFGIGKAANSVVAATALTPGVTQPILLNEEKNVQFPGYGEKIDNTAISIIAGAATSVNVTLFYDKVAKQ